MSDYKILNQIDGPEDIKKLSFQELDFLCAELRSRRI